MIDLNELSRQAYTVAKKREINGANIKTEPMPMLKHCATEVIEATEAYYNYCKSVNSDNLEKFENEIADIIACCLIISGFGTIDVEKALNRVMEKNRLRAEKQGDKL